MANTLNAFRNGAVGFIAWLGLNGRPREVRSRPFSPDAINGVSALPATNHKGDRNVIAVVDFNGD